MDMHFPASPYIPIYLYITPFLYRLAGSSSFVIAPCLTNVSRRRRTLTGMDFPPVERHSIHQDLMEGSPSIISGRMQAPAQHIRRCPTRAPLLAPRNQQRPLTFVIQTCGLQRSRSRTNTRHTKRADRGGARARKAMMREKQRPRGSRRDMTSKES